MSRPAFPSAAERDRLSELLQAVEHAVDRLAPASAWSKKCEEFEAELRTQLAAPTHSATPGQLLRRVL